MSNMTINYSLNDRNKSQGHGIGEDGHAARIFAWAPDFRLELRHQCPQHQPVTLTLGGHVLGYGLDEFLPQIRSNVAPLLVNTV